MRHLIAIAGFISFLSSATTNYFSNHEQYLYYMKLNATVDFEVAVDDEVAVFVEDEVLIGSFRFTQREVETGAFDPVCFADDNTISGKDGAYRGDILYFKFYDSSEAKLYSLSSSESVSFDYSTSLISAVYKDATLSLGDEIIIESNTTEINTTIDNTEDNTEVNTTTESDNTTEVNTTTDNTEQILPLKLSSQFKELTLGVDSSFVVEISDGKAPYSLQEYNSTIVDVVLQESTLSITPKYIGTSRVVVSDSLDNSRELFVVVGVEDLTLSKSLVELSKDNLSETISIEKGLKDYSLDKTLLDETVAEVTLNIDSVTIKALKSGVTFFTVEDSAGARVVVSIVANIESTEELNVDTDTASVSSTNSTPTISELTISKSDIYEDDIVTISVDAVDSDGDKLYYIWDISGVEIISDSGSSIEIKIPTLYSDKTIRASVLVYDKYSFVQTSRDFIAKNRAESEDSVVQESLYPIGSTSKEYKSGWQLISVPVNTTGFDLGSIDNLEVAWNFDNSSQKWNSYSPIEGSNGFYSAKNGIGFWIKLKNRTEIEFLEYDTEFKIGYSSYKSGAWNLIGLPFDIDRESVLEYFAVEKIYIFEDSTWFDVNAIGTIPKGVGFWIK
jgi:hypothetical protein